MTAPAVEPPEAAEEAVDLGLLSKVLEEFKGHRLAVIPLLQRMQDVYGYIPRTALEEISRRTRIPLSQLFGVATFYAQFRLKKRGKHLVRICDGTACHVRGAPKAIDAIAHGLHVDPGETTKDKKMSLEIVYCLGSCGLAPVAVVDEKVLGRLGPEALVERLRQLD